ncbi:hypothetical protein GCM10023063_20160 [Arthrobacter methylotrophus]
MVDMCAAAGEELPGGSKMGRPEHSGRPIGGAGDYLTALTAAWASVLSADIAGALVGSIWVGLVFWSVM